MTRKYAAGNEHRDILDARFAGMVSDFDWDIETMDQTGRVGAKEVRAWAVGSLGGYTWQNSDWTPRAGLQVDAASGDRNPNGNTLGTFNPLFPNGYYLQEAAHYTGTYGQVRLDWLIKTNTAFAVEVDHFAVGDVIERAAGRDSNYLSIEIKFGW